MTRVPTAAGAAMLQEDLSVVLRAYLQAVEIVESCHHLGPDTMAASWWLKRMLNHIHQQFFVELTHLAYGWPCRPEPHVEFTANGTAYLAVSDVV